MGVEVCKIFEVPMSDRLILFLLQNTRFILFLCETKPRNGGTACSAEQGFAFRFALRGMNSGELLRFKIPLDYLERVAPPDLGLSVAVPFSYHNGASRENRREASNLLRSFTVVLHIFLIIIQFR